MLLNAVKYVSLAFPGLVVCEATFLLTFLVLGYLHPIQSHDDHQMVAALWSAFFLPVIFSGRLLLSLPIGGVRRVLTKWQSWLLLGFTVGLALGSGAYFWGRVFQ